MSIAVVSRATLNKNDGVHIGSDSPQVPAPLRQARSRAIRDSEIAGEAFRVWSLAAECVIKYLASVLVSALAMVEPVAARRLVGRTLGADSLGAWEQAITECCRILARERPDPRISELVAGLTRKRRRPGDDFEVVEQGVRNLLRLLDAPDVPYNPSWLGVAKFLVFFRNKTRGHGARTAGWHQMAKDDLSLLVDRLLEHVGQHSVFFAERSSENRWLLLTNDCTALVSLDASGLADQTLVLVAFDAGAATEVGLGTELFSPAVDEERFFFANGSYKTVESSVEYMEYLSGTVTRRVIDPNVLSFTDLPRSRTAGLTSLVHTSELPHNLPRSADVFVERPQLEERLRAAVMQPQYPVVTLHGVGGSGKTALALHLAHELASSQTDRFEIVVWLSARDIDLLPEGIVETQPEVSTLEDMAELFSAVVEDFVEPADSTIELFRRELSEPTWKYLIVADNFETLDDPESVQRFITDAALAPTKVLITSRARPYAGDLPIDVEGLEVDEAHELMVREARERGCEGLLTGEVRGRLFEATDGRPYPIKLAIGLIGSGVPPPRAMDQLKTDRSLLEALFRRSYDLLPEPARYFALLVGNSHGRVPELLARVAISRRGFTFANAEEPAVRQAMAHRIQSLDGGYSYSTPSTARAFLRMEMPLDTLSEMVAEDVSFVREFRRFAQHEASYGLRLAGEIANRILEAEKAGTSTEDLLEILEQVAEVEPTAFLVISELRAQVGESTERQVDALRRGLELRLSQPKLWSRWAELERNEGRIDRSYQLLRQGIEASENPHEAAELVGQLLAMSSDVEVKDAVLKGDVDRFPAIRSGVTALEEHKTELNAGHLGYLAWLYLILGRKTDALEMVFAGLRLDPQDHRLLNLQSRLRDCHPELFGAELGEWTTDH